jgi:hypothetical protein
MKSLGWTFPKDFRVVTPTEWLLRIIFTGWVLYRKSIFNGGMTRFRPGFIPPTPLTILTILTFLTTPTL